MRNDRLLPYETIVQTTSGEPEAVNTVLQYYGRRIRYASRISGQADKEAEDFITETLLEVQSTMFIQMKKYPLLAIRLLFLLVRDWEIPK